MPNVNPNSGEYDFRFDDLNATAIGNTQLVAAVTGRRIRVIFLLVTNKGASNVNFKLQSATTDITEAHMLASDGGGFALNAWPFFICQTVAGEALNANLSAGGDVAIHIGYTLV